MAAEGPPAGVTVTYSSQYRRCGKPGCATCANGAPGHGPYWYAYWYLEGKRHSRYLGRTAPAGVSDGPETGPATHGSLVAVTTTPETRGRLQQAASAPAHPPALRVRTLGGFAVWRLGERIPDAMWSVRDAGALLKCVLSAPGQRLLREQVMEWLWPDALPAVGRQKLSQALHQARRALASPGAGTRAGACLQQEGGQLALAPEPLVNGIGEDTGAAAWLDAAAFDRAATNALAGRDIVACRAALELYGGVYLPDDQGEAWAEGPRQRLSRRYYRLLLHLADIYGARGELAEAAEQLQALLAVDPAHEEAATQLITLLINQGKETEALRAYQALAAALDEELGVAPSGVVQGLRSRLLSERTRARPAERPPRQPLPSRPTNLPAALTSFVGRAWEREEVTRLLRGEATAAGPPCRLLTLSGVGGVGKTRLALEAGAGLVEHYPDGVWLVRLDAVVAMAEGGVTPVAQAIAAALGVQEEAGRALSVTLAEFLRRRQLLLVLDNCEHLAHVCATLVAGLLEQCAGLSILATSRRALGVPGESVWVVPTLATPPESVVLPEALAQYEAVQLFVTRGRSARADFALTERSAATVGRICRQLDGVPLAIELAAARLGILGIEEVAARLGDFFRLLTGGSRVLMPRQQTLRATMEWSHSLLRAPEQTLLRRLSTFAGGCTLDAVEGVCAGEMVPREQVVTHLAELVRDSLVVLQPEESPPRYRLLEPVRQYALEQLETSGEAGAVREQHLDWYVALAEEAEPELSGVGQRQWLARLEAEHDNIRAALTWSLRGGGEISSGLRLAGAIGRFWHLRGYAREGRDWLDGLLHRGEEIVGQPRAKALHAAGTLAYLQGNHARARMLEEHALALWRAHGERPGIALALAGLANIAYLQGDYNEASSLNEAALVEMRATGNMAGIARVLTTQGSIAFYNGEHARARSQYMEALALQQQLGASASIALLQSNLALLAAHEGDIEQARSLYQEALATQRGMLDKAGAAATLNNLGELENRAGNCQKAESYLQESLSLNKELGHSKGMAHNLGNLSAAAYEQGQYPHALMVLQEAMILFRDLGDRRNVGETLRTIALVVTHLGLATQAARLFAAAEAAWGSTSGAVLPGDRASHDQAINSLRNMLGETAFNSAWEAGHALPTAAAVVEALALTAG